MDVRVAQPGGAELVREENGPANKGVGRVVPWNVDRLHSRRRRRHELVVGHGRVDEHLVHPRRDGHKVEHRLRLRRRPHRRSPPTTGDAIVVAGAHTKSVGARRMPGRRSMQGVLRSIEILNYIAGKWDLFIRKDTKLASPISGYSSVVCNTFLVCCMEVMRTWFLW